MALRGLNQWKEHWDSFMQRIQPLIARHELSAFLAEFAKNPFHVGALMPTCAEVTGAAANEAFKLCEREGRILEVGSGPGHFVEMLAKRRFPLGRVTCVELSPMFATRLAERFPQVHVIQGPAEELGLSIACEPVDVIYSTIPLARMNPADKFKLVEAFQRVLKPSGVLIQLSLVGFSTVPAKMHGLHQEYMITSWTNVPPATLWRYRRKKIRS